MQWLVNGLTTAISAYQTYNAYQKYSWKIPDSWPQDGQFSFEGAREFARQHGLRKDVKIFVGSLEGEPAKALGNNSIPSSDIAILIDENYVVNDSSPQGLSEAMNVVMRHEFSHLRNNDMFGHSSITAAASIASAILGITYQSPLTTLFLTALSNIAVPALYSRYMEARADDEAFAGSSSEELQAFQMLLKQGISTNRTVRNTSDSLIKFLFSLEGDNRGQMLTHPSLTSRIKKLEAILKFRQ